ncbi:hypothetical protein OPV22_016578 [Ensete ventricosum]|uniref:Alcohol dehydrogenase-like N-terminal domain-containing protein n=1 Tax=Ensete ventricosum TaxID=4639 RepID=A0AAV8QVB2_ENSVE|nr:hypothetical protein OPV22_016578 [Ensete ventricosum]
MAGRTMHAVQYDGYGGGYAGLKHVEIQVSSPKKDEVLLRVEAASINQIDWKIQKVTDVAGEVVEVGPGVHSFKPGDKVVSMLNFRNAAEGASLPFAALEALSPAAREAGQPSSDRHLRVLGTWIW